MMEMGMEIRLGPKIAPGVLNPVEMRRNGTIFNWAVIYRILWNDYTYKKDTMDMKMIVKKNRVVGVDVVDMEGNHGRIMEKNYLIVQEWDQGFDNELKMEIHEDLKRLGVI